MCCESQNQRVTHPPTKSKSRTLWRALWAVGLLASFIPYTGGLYLSAQAEAVFADLEVTLPVLTVLFLTTRHGLVAMGGLFFLLAVVMLFVARTRRWPEVVIAVIVAFFVIGFVLTTVSVIIPMRQLTAGLEAGP